jgi:hypothetical protein
MEVHNEALKAYLGAVKDLSVSVADLHRFDEYFDTHLKKTTDPIQCKKSDPVPHPHQSEKPDSDPQHHKLIDVS